MTITTLFRDKLLAADVLLSAIEGNFDVWRKNYDRLDINDLIWINCGLDKFYSDQNHSNYDVVKELIDTILRNSKNSLTILELGCHRGYLAKDILSNYNVGEVTSYYGYDINYPAIDASVVDDYRYESIKMTDWFHKYLFAGEVLISCHTLEHFNVAQIRQIMEAVQSSVLKYLIFEVPFNYRGNWDGGNNSHVLNLDSEGFVSIMKDYGFKLFSIVDTTRTSREKIYNQWMFGLERI